MHNTSLLCTGKVRMRRAVTLYFVQGVRTGDAPTHTHTQVREELMMSAGDVLIVQIRGTDPVYRDH